MTAIAVMARSQGPKPNEKENCMPGKGDAKEMPEGFAPSEFDALVGWARQNFHHAGNRRFRSLIAENVHAYTQADSKIARGHIITEIVKQMQLSSPSGTGFLKMNPFTARWSFIGTDKAKDKVGHAFRKALMSSQEGSIDDSSKNNKTGDNDTSKKEIRGRKCGKRMAREPEYPISSKKAARGPAAAVQYPPQSAALPFLAPTAAHGVSGILSKSPKYTGGSMFTNSENLPSSSRPFLSPGGSPLKSSLMCQSSLGQDDLPLTNGIGLSPVARNIFDVKNFDSTSSEAGSSRQRSSISAVASDPSNVNSLPLNSDDEAHHNDGGNSYPEQQGAAAFCTLPPHQYHNMYQPAQGGASYYFPPFSGEGILPHAMPLPPAPISSRAPPVPPLHHQMMVPPPGPVMTAVDGPQQPHPPGYYPPPGYYYYPGFMPPPPEAAASPAFHPSSFYPGGPPPMLPHPPYYNYYHYYPPPVPHNLQGDHEEVSDEIDNSEEEDSPLPSTLH